MLRPAVQALAWDDFDRIDEASMRALSATRSALPHIKRLLASHRESPFRPAVRANSFSLSRCDDSPQLVVSIFVSSAVAFWEESGENPAVFCYLIAWGIFATLRSRALVPLSDLCED